MGERDDVDTEGEGVDHDVPPDLTELHEVLEYQEAVASTTADVEDDE